MCPVIDLVEEITGGFKKTFLIALVSAISPSGVEVPCAFIYETLRSSILDKASFIDLSPPSPEGATISWPSEVAPYPVISGGAGVLVLECYEHAKARGAKIYAEITGYGATSDGHDMVAPSGEGGERSMKLALSNIENRKISYINAHGTSTPAGDVVEIKAIRRIFGNGDIPPISSTKSLTGHSLGAAGVHEAIYSILMMHSGFLSASSNIFNLDSDLKTNEILMKSRNNVEFDTVISNSFGFGGTNATLAFSKLRD